MTFASVGDLKRHLIAYIRRARKTNEPIVVTRYGRPYALIRALKSEDLGRSGWKELAERQLSYAWENDNDALYDYL
ncbi:MAG TPA: type II toxin-antitoxin system prevent-host-death family antitoxin [Thermoanaerobaculia bacterium]